MTRELIGLYLPVVNLNLDNARLAREIEERVKNELRRLPASEQKSVLERVAVDVLAGLNAPTSGPTASSRARKSPSTPQPAPSSASETEGKQWEKILAYCNAHPTADGTFHNAEVAKGLFPEKMKKARNAAQTQEKARVEMLLKSLCEGIEQPARKPGPGRKPIPLRDAVFAAVMKVYTTFSGRRASTDIRGCEERGHIGKAMHYNSVFRTIEDPATTAILTRLIEESAAPLAEIENLAGQFAQDSTGFSTVTYDRWFDQKHGKLMAAHPWVKLHVMIGTVTNVVTGVKVSDEGDCPVLPELLAQTTKGFKVREVSGDKAYLSKKNLAAIEAVGAVPFIPFKSNSVGMASKSAHWKRMWAHFSLKSEDFLNRYHRRSNAESTMWMIKSKFGGAVRSKLPTAQVNEVLCKVLCHNLTCIVHAITEFGIEADFAKPSAKAPALALVQP